MSELLAFIHLGFHHITDPEALDHMLFLLALAAIYRGRDWRDSLWVVTAFTVGHSITGGYVFRGEGDALQGQYFFADFVQGKIFTLRFDGSTWVATDRTSQIALCRSSWKKSGSRTESNLPSTATHFSSASRYAPATGV